MKYLVRNYGKKDGVAYEQIHGHHICSDEELELFGTPSPDSSSIKNYYGNGARNGKKYLFCLDWDNMEEGKQVRIWGVENDDNY